MISGRGSYGPRSSIRHESISPRMGDAPADRSVSDVQTRTMDEYKEHLRRLAMHDYALLEAIAVEGSSFAASVIDERTPVTGASRERHDA